jgi:DNA repair protein RadC
MTIKLTKSQKIRVLNSQDIAAIMQQVLRRENRIDRGKEHLWLVCLDMSNRILLVELISLGSQRQTIADPVEIFSFALQKKAVKIILVHNHPSGNLLPSPADNELTSKMMSIGEFIHVPVIEHLIISENGYFSFVDSGLYARLDKVKADLTFKQVDKLNARIKELNKAKKNQTKQMTEALKNREKEILNGIIKKALLEGVSVKKIVKLTGLSEKEIKIVLKK